MKCDDDSSAVHQQEEIVKIEQQQRQQQQKGAVKGNQNRSISSSSSSSSSRREMISKIVSVATKTATVTAMLAAASLPSSSSAAAAEETTTNLSSSSSLVLLKELRALIQQAVTQLEVVPQLIRDEKWDAVRVVLTNKPLADCWINKNTPMLKSLADVVGEIGNGDEFAILEAREDLIGHLRYLDTAVYNNVFNPIATEGKSGASKALIDSYYEDPIREYNASKLALDELLKSSEF